jgi:hypothetical protein
MNGTPTITIIKTLPNVLTHTHAISVNILTRQQYSPFNFDKSLCPRLAPCGCQEALFHSTFQSSAWAPRVLLVIFETSDCAPRDRRLSRASRRAGSSLFSQIWPISQSAHKHTPMCISFISLVSLRARIISTCVTLSMSLAPGGVCVFLISNYGIHIFRNFGAILGPTP